MGEFELIRRYFAAAPCAQAAAGVVLGIGDDCALLQPAVGQQLAVSTDTLVTGDLKYHVAQKALDLVEEQAKMQGIVHSLRHENDLDEAPGAYKDIDQVMQDQVDLVKALVKLRPLGSIKG